MIKFWYGSIYIKNLKENERILYILSYLATNKDTLPWFVQAKPHTRAAGARS
jgi:hypothetical protein